VRTASLTRGALLSSAACALCGCSVSRFVSRLQRSRGCPPPAFDRAALDAAMSVRIIRGETLATFAKRTAYEIAVPPGATGEAVAYLLPGRGSTAYEAMAAAGMRAALGAWARGGGRPFVLATMDAGESYFHARRSGEDRLWFATRELPAIVARKLGRPAVREALLGLSMGGYGALLAAEREPKRFRAVAVSGPAIFPSYDDERRSVGDAFDDAGDFARNDVIAHAAALRGVPALVQCGLGDPFLPGVRAFAHAAPASVRVREMPGNHDDCFWRERAPSMLAFVAAHL
jgi:S-formylglutathione hydrolase FrmB